MLQWYAIHVFSGHEKKIQRYLENEIEQAGLTEKIPRVLIPSEDVVEMRDGKKRVKNRIFFPGYMLVEMELDKVTQHIVPSNSAKAAVISGMDFDFAFVDAIHSFEGVQFDFECVKKCGRVLFHDYQVMTGVTEFIDTLPDEQVVKEYPFAYWKADGHGSE